MIFYCISLQVSGEDFIISFSPKNFLKTKTTFTIPYREFSPILHRAQGIVLIFLTVSEEHFPISLCNIDALITKKKCCKYSFHKMANFTFKKLFCHCTSHLWFPSFTPPSSSIPPLFHPLEPSKDQGFQGQQMNTAEQYTKPRGINPHLKAGSGKLVIGKRFQEQAKESETPPLALSGLFPKHQAKTHNICRGPIVDMWKYHNCCFSLCESM